MVWRIAFLVVPLLPGTACTSARAPTQKECKDLAASLQGPPSRERLAKLEAAYARCGSGYGLLSQRAEVELALGDPSSAALHVREELAQPFPSPGAMPLALHLLPRLSETDAAPLRELGTSAGRPLHVSSNAFDRIPWIRTVTCGGADPAATEFFTVRAGRPTMFGVRVECPPGRKHELYFDRDRLPEEDRRPVQIDAPSPEVDVVLRQVRELYGIDSNQALREELLAADSSRSHGWLLGIANDSPEAVSVWGRLVTADPDDLEALFYRAQLQAGLGDVEGGAATLARASPDTVRVRDQRGGLGNPSMILSLQCALRFQQRRLTEARSLCMKGLERGSKATSNAFLARIALVEGDLVAADKFSAPAAAAGKTAEWTLRAVVLRLRGGAEPEVSALIQQVLDSKRPTHLARLLRDGAPRTARQWIEEEERDDREAWAIDLASCGHLYLELDAKDRSARCFEASERIAPEPARAARALHLSEKDPERAQAEMDRALASSRHQCFLSAKGIIEHRLGNDRVALDWLEQALAMDGHDWRAAAAVHAACERLLDPDCESRSSKRSRSLKITH